jgi:hypothetical protein
VRFFRREDCSIDQGVVIAEVRERLAVSNRAKQKFHMER